MQHESGTFREPCLPGSSQTDLASQFNDEVTKNFVRPFLADRVLNRLRHENEYATLDLATFEARGGAVSHIGLPVLHAIQRAQSPACTAISCVRHRVIRLNSGGTRRRGFDAPLE